MAYPVDEYYKWWSSIGRVGLVFLQKAWSIGNFNPCLAGLAGVLFLILGTLLWTYLLSLFSDGNDIALFLFAAVFITSGVWIDQIYFRLQCAETMFIIILAALAVFITIKSYAPKKQDSIKFVIFERVVLILLLAFSISVYQSVILLYAAGISGCIFLSYYTLDKDEQYGFTDLIKIAITIAVAFVLYFIILFLAQKFVFETASSGYVFGQVMGGRSLKTGILRFCMYLYMLSFGNLGFLSKIVDPVIASNSESGYKAVGYFHDSVRAMADPLLIPVIILFVINIILILREREMKSRISFVLSAVMIPVSMVVIAAAGNGFAAARTQYGYPYSFGFMLFILAINIKNRSGIMIPALFVITTISVIYHVQINTALYASDLRRYEYDRDLSFSIGEEVRKLAPEAKKIYIAGIRPPEADTGFIQTEFTGISLYSDYTNHEGQEVALMRILGMDYEIIEEGETLEHIQKDILPHMNEFPAEGSLKQVEDAVVVCLSK